MWEWKGVGVHYNIRYNKQQQKIIINKFFKKLQCAPVKGATFTVLYTIVLSNFYEIFSFYYSNGGSFASIVGHFNQTLFQYEKKNS